MLKWISFVPSLENVFRAEEGGGGNGSEGARRRPLNSRVDLYDGPVGQHALLPASGEQVLHRLVRECDFLTAVWEVFLWRKSWEST